MVSRPRALMLLVAGAVVVLNATGWVISVAAELPSEFDGVRDPDEVLSDSVTVGTLLAAPLTTLVALGVAMLLAWRGGRWLRSAGLVGAAVLGVLFTVGTLAEPLHPEASDPPVAFLLAWKVLAAGLCAGLAILSAVALYRTWRSGETRPTELGRLT